jgi:hypothetical protein
VEGEEDERRGKKRGRGQMNIPGSCACAAAGKGCGVVHSACALDHHHPCLALYVPPKFSLIAGCMRIPLSVQQCIILFRGFHAVYSVALAPGTTAPIRVAVQY